MIILNIFFLLQLLANKKKFLWKNQEKLEKGVLFIVHFVRICSGITIYFAAAAAPAAPCQESNCKWMAGWLT